MKKSILLILLALGLAQFSFGQQYDINVLKQGQVLLVNQSLRSKNGMYNLSLQQDGNLCLYKNGKDFVWCTMTNGHSPGKLVMQTDGNLCLYDANGKYVWGTDTYRGGPKLTGSYLKLNGYGQLVLYNRYNQPIWTAKKGRLY